MRKLLVVGLVLISGCASLRSDVYEKVNIGDPSEKVKSVLGEPDNSDGDKWVYIRRADTCEVSLKEDSVVDIFCVTDKTYVHPARKVGRVVSMFLQKMGEGMQNANKRTVECTSQQSGDTVYSHCNVDR